jgi:hypothetical protein
MTRRLKSLFLARPHPDPLVSEFPSNLVWN